MQNKLDDVYQNARYQDEVNQEESDQEDFFENMPVFDARWFVVCLIVVAPLWIWPFDFPQIFAQFGISIIKAVGWIIGLATIVLVSSVLLSSIGKALLKASHPQNIRASGTRSHQ